jgi:hypothetical protein
MGKGVKEDKGMRDNPMVSTDVLCSFQWSLNHTFGAPFLFQDRKKAEKSDGGKNDIVLHIPTL